eukprot:4778795-Lingulodinium_polyedra.AAC.2
MAPAWSRRYSRGSQPRRRIEQQERARHGAHSSCSGRAGSALARADLLRQRARQRVCGALLAPGGPLPLRLRGYASNTHSHEEDVQISCGQHDCEGPPAPGGSLPCCRRG